MQRTRLRVLVLFLLAFFATTQSRLASAQKIDAKRMLDPNRLLDIRITIAKSDWDQLRRQARNAGAFFGGGTIEDPYTYFKADLQIEDVTIPSVGVRKKGLFGSADTTRPSLKIKFDEFVKQDPFKGLSRLTLNNNKQDTSQVSQFLTYRLFRAAGVHAPRSNFARVTVNGEFLGIYSHVESIKKPFLKDSFGDKGGNLYEGTLTDFHPKTIEKIEVKTNEKKNDLADIKRLAALLSQEKLSIEDLDQVIDVENFMRYWVLEGILRFWDGYASNQNNFYFYMNPGNGRGYFIPWGADGSFTRSGGPFGFGSQQTGTAIYAQGILANRLYHTDGIPERYRQTMLTLLAEVWKEDELLAEVDRVEKLVSGHLHASQQQTAQSMNEVREFIRTRKATLKRELESWPPPNIPSEPRKPQYQVAVGSASGSFATTFTETGGADATETGSAELRLQLDDKTVDFKQLGATATKFQVPRFGFGGPRPQNGGPQPAPPAMVNLTIAGLRKSDGERMSVSFIIPLDSFADPDENGLAVSGSLTIGQSRGFGGFPGFGGGPRRTVTGKIRMKENGTADGKRVAGTIDVKIVEVHGGFFNRRSARPPGGFGGGSQALVRALDQDLDGELSEEEITNAAAALKKLDRNKDGQLTGAELTGAARN